jgi:hypothetical protein
MISTPTVLTTKTIVVIMLMFKPPVRRLVVAVAMLQLSATARMILIPVINIRLIVATHKSILFVKRLVINANDDDPS